MTEASPEVAGHRYDVDWLRVFATYLLFVFHVAMVFNPAPFYHIRNADVSFIMLVLAGFIGLWHMPLFFLLAGWSIYASLMARDGRGFVRERIFKLWIPLVMGCVLLMPPIKYIELRSGLDANYAGLYVAAPLQDSFRTVIPAGLPAAAPFDDSFIEFLPTFFTHLERFTWAHLWFLAYLLTFTFLYLPLFAWWRRSTRDPFAGLGAAWAYLPIPVLALIQVTLRERWPGLQNLYDDWANVAYYSTYLIAGFALARYPALEGIAHREWTRALGVGVATTVFLLLALLGVIRAPALLLAGTAVAGWCFVVALLGFARGHLAASSPTLSYLTESAFPVYILHQSAIVLVGYLVIRLSMGIAAKYAILLAASVTVTLAVYHFAVRPFALTRFLFGMKSRRGARRALLPAQYRTAAGVLLSCAGLGIVTPAAAASPVGRWYAEGGAAQVEIRSCGEALCGRVVWLRSPLDEDGCRVRDRHNPEVSRRSQPVVGLEILQGLQKSSDREDVWEGGTIYDPTTGHTYRARLSIEGDSRLEVRGYLGIPLLGRTTRWFRVGAEEQLCRQSS